MRPVLLFETFEPHSCRDPHHLPGLSLALTHLQILLDAGVPRERVIVERSSTNTLENVTRALPLIADSIELECIEAVVVVAKWYHCRRATMTLKRHLPAGIRNERIK